ncbi:serine hydrolase [Streptomyces albulus]|nr:serine hydrolase domain-containing protein [Streptomyces noursei]MCZ1019004.1 serine hydrolase [Streptomyces noursei]
MRDGVLHEALHRPPGETVEYTDRAALVLGYLAAYLSGQRLDQLAATRIWRPLEMTETSFAWHSPEEPSCEERNKVGKACEPSRSRRAAPHRVSLTVLSQETSGRSRRPRPVRMARDHAVHYSAGRPPSPRRPHASGSRLPQRVASLADDRLRPFLSTWHRKSTKQRGRTP